MLNLLKSQTKLIHGIGQILMECGDISLIRLNHIELTVYMQCQIKQVMLNL